MSDFEEWLAKHYPAKYPDNNPTIKAAYIAGATAMCEKAAEVAESYYRSDDVAVEIATAIRQIEVE